MTLLKYDFFYLRKTSKFIIFPAVAVIFAILSPLSAMYINELLTLLMTESGPAITFPDPTVIDSYAQYISNLYEIFLIVTIFVAVSVFIREKTKGYLPLVLSKPINRTKYLISKITSLSILIFGSLIISGFVFGYYTYILFGEIDVMIVVNTTMVFMVYVIFILSLSMLFSQLFNNYPTASILTFVGYIVFNILGNFEKSILNYMPGRLTYRITEIIVGISETSTLIWNVVITLLVSIIFITISVLKFRRYDL